MNPLVLAILLPLLGALVIATFSEAQANLARWAALFTTLATLVITVAIVSRFPREDFAASFAWLTASDQGFNVRLALGLDGLSVWLFALSALLSLTGVLVSWRAIDQRVPAFYALLLLLETGMLGVFAARDLILFYVFFEFTLIPLFFLIGVWGSEERRYAAIKFFLFTLAGSLLTFLGLLAIVIWNYQHGEPRQLAFDFASLGAGLAAHPMDRQTQLWVFLALFAGFAVKVPLFPLHTWLPLAHVQAPTAGSVLLAGVLLKIGTYGFVRFSLPWLPEATALCAPWVLLLATAGIVYGALVALAQSDLKRLIAYSSVSHLGFAMLGLFALNHAGIEGGTLQMVNHGLSTGGLFALVGMLYERFHTREISAMSGLARRLPWLAFFMLVFTFSSIGLPGLNGFVGEFLVLLAMFQRGWTETGPTAWLLRGIAVVAVSGVVLGAWYMLWLVERVFFGPLRIPSGAHDEHAVNDLGLREIAALTPLAALVLWIGLVPQFFLERMSPTLAPISQVAERAWNERGDRESASKVAGSTATGSGAARRTEADSGSLAPPAERATRRSRTMSSVATRADQVSTIPGVRRVGRDD